MEVNIYLGYCCWGCYFFIYWWVGIKLFILVYEGFYCKFVFEVVLVYILLLCSNCMCVNKYLYCRIIWYLSFVC